MLVPFRFDFNLQIPKKLQTCIAVNFCHRQRESFHLVAKARLEAFADIICLIQIKKYHIVLNSSFPLKQKRRGSKLTLDLGDGGWVLPYMLIRDVPFLGCFSSVSLEKYMTL